MSLTQQIRLLISGDARGALNALGRLRSELAGLSSATSKFTALWGTLAGSVIGAALVSITKDAIDAADALAEMSERTGVAVEILGALKYAATLSGVEFDTLGKALNKLNLEIASAGQGSEESIKRFEDLGVSFRDVTTKELRPTSEVMLDMLDAFEQLGDGADKTAVAAGFFGSKLAGEMVPFLSLGSKAVGDLRAELEALGGAISGEFAAEAADFKDNLDRLKTAASAAGIALGNALVPALNDYLERLLDFRQAGLSFADLLFGQNYADKFKTVTENVNLLTAEIAELQKQQASAAQADQADFAARIARQKRLLDFYTRQQKRADGDAPGEQAADAVKRIALQANLQKKLADLEQLRGIAAGKISADILDDDKKRTAAQIANAEKLRDALRSAWQANLEAAKKASQEAVDLLAKAAGKRTAGAQSAAEIRRSALDPAIQEALNRRDSTNLADEAIQAALSAKLAAFNGRAEAAARLADQAQAAAESAARFADKLGDPEQRARATERIAEAQALADEARARVKTAEAADLEQTAQAQAELLATLEAQLADLQTQAAALEIQVQIDAATAAIATIQQQLDALHDKTVTVTVNTVRTGATGTWDDSSSAEPEGGFARGGWTGPGSKYQPAGIVHANEFVLRQEVVRRSGMLKFLRELNRTGRLPGYAAGGLVGALQVPTMHSAPSPSGVTAQFVFPQFGTTFQGSMAGAEAARMSDFFAREALRKGGRA